MFRQGDILLVPTGKPKGKEVDAEAGRLILARGEATGHHHSVMEGTATLRIDGDRLYLSTENGTELVHQEHGAIPIAPGNYEVVRQREYSPEEIRSVRD